MNKADGLNWGVRLGFGFGDFAQNLVYPAVSMYLLFFYTEVFKISPAVAATMFLVVQLADLLWNPLVGVFMDRHNPLWGKYRSYLVIAGIPLAAFAVLCFGAPLCGFSGASKVIYAFATYAGFTMLFTVVNVAYGALGSSLSRDVDEITILTAVRIFMANAGCMVVSMGVPLLVYAMAGGREPPWRMAFFMGLNILPSFVLMPLVPNMRRRLGRRGMFFISALVAGVGMAALYVLSRIGRIEDHIGVVYAAQSVKASGIIVATGCMWALVPEVITYSEHLTGRRVSGIVNAITGVSFRVGMAIGKIVPGLVLAWTGYRVSSVDSGSNIPADPHAWLWTMAIFSFAAAVFLVVSFSHTKERIVMEGTATTQVKMCDIWHEFRRNVPLRIMVLFFTVAFAMMSVGNAAGAYFMNGMEGQSALAQEGIRWLVCVIPAILLVAAAVAVMRYPLDDDSVDRLAHDIESKRKTFPSCTSSN